MTSTPSAPGGSPSRHACIRCRQSSQFMSALVGGRAGGHAVGQRPSATMPRRRRYSRTSRRARCSQVLTVPTGRQRRGDLLVGLALLVEEHEHGRGSRGAARPRRRGSPRPARPSRRRAGPARCPAGNRPVPAGAPRWAIQVRQRLTAMPMIHGRSGRDESQRRRLRKTRGTLPASRPRRRAGGAAGARTGRTRRPGSGPPGPHGLGVTSQAAPDQCGVVGKHVRPQGHGHVRKYRPEGPGVSPGRTPGRGAAPGGGKKAGGYDSIASRSRSAASSAVVSSSRLPRLQ